MTFKFGTAFHSNVMLVMNSPSTNNGHNQLLGLMLTPSIMGKETVIASPKEKELLISIHITTLLHCLRGNRHTGQLIKAKLQIW